MTPEDTIVCLCTRQNFGAAHQRQLTDLCQSQEIQWDVVYATAEENFVSPLVYVNLSHGRIGGRAIPQAILDKFKKSYIHNVFVKQGTAKILDQILALFAQKGIDVMLVKGAAMSLLVYEQPWYTKAHDVDLVIKARREEIDQADHREIVAVLEGFNHQRNQFKEHIEYDYFEHHDVTMNNVLAVDPHRLWQEARRIQVNGHDVLVLTPEDMLIAAAINSCRKRFFRLKSLFDVAAIVEKHPDLDWGVLISKARDYEANTILYTTFLVLQKTLGCPLPERVLYDLKVNPIRAFGIRRLVSALCRTMSLRELFTRTEGTLVGRQFSWPLVLTYATYRLNHLFPKLREICSAWRKRGSAVPKRF
jgi:hypothetical protein